MKRNMSATPKPLKHTTEQPQLDEMYQNAKQAFTTAQTTNNALKAQITSLNHASPGQQRGDNLRNIRAQNILLQQRDFEIQEKLKLLQRSGDAVERLERQVERRLDELSGDSEISALNKAISDAKTQLWAVNGEIDAIRVQNEKVLESSQKCAVLENELKTRNNSLMGVSQSLQQDISLAQQNLEMKRKNEAKLTQKLSEITAEIAETIQNSNSQIRQMQQILLAENRACEASVQESEACQINIYQQTEEIEFLHEDLAEKQQSNEELKELIETQNGLKSQIQQQIAEEQERFFSLNEQQSELERKTKEFVGFVLGRADQGDLDVEELLQLSFEKIRRENDEK